MKYWLGIAAACAAAIAAPTQAERAVTEFTAQDTVSRAEISPDGNKLVAEMEVGGERKLVILPLDGSGPSIPIGLGKGDLLSIDWVGNDWLVAVVGRNGHYLGREVYLRRVVAFRSDGSNMNVIDTANGMADSGGVIRWIAKDGSPRILLEYRESIFIGEPGFFPKVAMVDISKNDFSRAAGEMEGVWNWYADGEGAVRFGIGQEDGGRKARLVYREGASGLFKEVASAREDDPLLVPELFLRDGKALTISEQEGFAGVYEMDLNTMQVGGKVFSVPGYDVSAIIEDPLDPHKLRGISWVDQRNRVQWFDPRFQAIQQTLNASFPANTVSIVSSSFDANRHVIFLGGATDTYGYFLYDAAAKRMTPIARSKASGWAPVRTYRYKARDGLEIEAIVTTPPDKEAKNLPVIIMPHGGPRWRDTESWDEWQQFFADRGYLVIQPNFRGSTGYGEAFERAGVGEWGLKMQDDVDDALAWAVAQGMADPKRACIVGGSYGGYVAMRAAQRNPELYRCAISYAGVSDLLLMMRRARDDYFGPATRDWLEKQSPDLGVVSPINHAEEFGIPILLMHGKEDDRVPIEQSERMAKALRAAGKNFEYIEQPKADHHFTRDADLHEFLLAAERFLDKYNPAN